MTLTLIVGGQKTGKSTVAARLASTGDAPVTVVAPAVPTDAEFAERIARHRADRPAHWSTIETFDLLGTLETVEDTTTVIVDALDTWLGQRMGEAGLLPADDVPTPLGSAGAEAAASILGRVDAFADRAAERSGHVLVVAGQPGMGLIGPSPATRRYVDLHGQAVQRLSAAAHRALLVVAGRTIELPAPPPDLS